MTWKSKTKKELEVEKCGAEPRTSDQKDWNQVLASESGPALEDHRGHDSVHWKLPVGEPQTWTSHHMP